MKTSMRSPMGTHRQGVVLIVIVGVSALLIALTFSLALRVGRNLQAVNQSAKTAQAYLMMQAARVYLSGRWLDGSVAGQDGIRAQQEGVFFFTSETTISTASQTWTPSTSTAPSTFIPNKLCTYAPATLRGAGWFGFKAASYSSSTPAVPTTFLVIGAGGAGFKPSAAQTGLTPDKDSGPHDVRLYGTYDPSTDRFTMAGTTPDGSAGGTAWATLMATP